MRFRNVANALTLALTLALTTVWASGCETAGSTGGPGNSGDLASMQAGLEAFQSCDEVRDYLNGVVIGEMDDAIAMYEECEARGEWCGYYAYDMAIGAPTSSRGGAGAMDAATGGSGDGAAPPGNQGGEGGGASTPDPAVPHSDTNVQEQGVDEADIVKVDDAYLYVLSGNKLRIVRSTPVADMTLEGNATIEGSPMEMFLAGDRLAVFSNTYRYNSSDGYDGGGKPTEPGGVPQPAEPAPDAMGGAGDSGGSDGAFEERPQALTLEDLPQLSGQILKVTVFDVSDRTNPQVLRETYLEASYVSSRMVGTRVHLVANAYPELPQFDWYSCVDPPTNGGGRTTTPSDGPDDRPPVAVDGGSATSTSTGTATDAGAANTEPVDPPPFEEKGQALSEGLQACRADFVQLLAEAELDDILPQRVDIVAGGAPQTESLVSCGTFYHPSVTMGLNVLAVVSFDLAEDGGAVASTGILGSSNTVYASATSLYVSTYMYDYWRWERAAISDPAAAQQRTAVHAFDITAEPAYVASGFVQGEVLNQFSMSEHNGNLRIATTMRNWDAWGPMAGGVAGGVATSGGAATGTAQVDVATSDDVVEDNPTAPSDVPLSSTDNLITVLGREGDQLVEVGKLTGLGEPDERIFAARFFGDLGYVVTFRQMDPLYVIDLSDPTNPQKRGALHVPGFSSYIHPLGDTHLLTIGQGSTDPTAPTRTDGLKLSVYDVSDADNPTEVGSLVVPAYSEAQYNHKAFTYFEHLGLLAIPIDSYWWYEDGQSPLNGLALFKVDQATGVEAVGSISHADLVPEPSDTPDGMTCYGHYLPQVRRGVFMGDLVYSISDVGVKANETTGDLAELNVVSFPDDANMWGDSGWGYRDCWMDEPGVGGGDEPGQGSGGGEVPPDAGTPDMR